jgi:hypothetical protein
MKTIEKVMLTIIIAGIAMKFLGIPGAGIILTLSVLLLSLLYYVLGFAFFNGIPISRLSEKNLTKTIPPRRMVGAIGAGLVISEILIGVLFKIQLWPLANLMLSIGLFLASIVLIIAVVRYLKKKDKLFYHPVFLRIGIALFIGFSLYFIPEISIVKLQFRNNPEVIQAYEKTGSLPGDTDSVPQDTN